jgi:hypothetical protein
LPAFVVTDKKEVKRMGSAATKPLLEKTTEATDEIVSKRAALPKYVCTLPPFPSNSHAEGSKDALAARIAYYLQIHEECKKQMAHIEANIQTATTNLRELESKWNMIYEESKFLAQYDLGCANNLTALSENSKTSFSNFANSCKAVNDTQTTAREVYDTLQALFAGPPPETPLSSPRQASSSG